MIEQSKHDWRADAISAYSLEPTASARLVARIASLTGRVVERETVFADQQADWATVVVDGTRFSLDRRGLVVVRACVGCTVARLESPPIASSTDLGYALSIWQPRCPHCPEEDCWGRTEALW